MTAWEAGSKRSRICSSVPMVSSPGSKTQVWPSSRMGSLAAGPFPRPPPRPRPRGALPRPPLASLPQDLAISAIGNTDSSSVPTDGANDMTVPRLDPRSHQVGCIYSEVSDANIDNLKVAIMHALRKGAQVVIMGPKLPLENATLQAVQDEHKDVNVRFIEDYDERLSHLILAGSDIILCSSFHDQVYQLLLKAIKYGSAPISINLRSAELRHSEKHDFGSATPSQYVVSAFADMSLSEALDEIKNEPSRWAQRIKDGMSRDFSWDAECCDIHLAAYKHIKNL